jgi:hypothetical protein
MRSHKLSLVIAAAACGTALPACGGSSSNTLSRSELVSKANAICTTAQTAAKAVPQPASIQAAGQAAAYFDKIGPITDTETTQLQALKPDSSVAPDWNAFISAQQAANTLLQTIRKKADAKDPSGLQDLGKIQGAGQQVASTATKLGATVCAQ